MDMTQEQILQYFYESSITKLIIAIFEFTGMTIAMAIDLIFGIRKAKVNGIYTSSRGMRETTIKAGINYAVFVMTLIIDVINPLGLHVALFQFPIFSTLWAAYIIGTEAYSVYEKADKKMRKKKADQAKEIVELLTNLKDFYGKIKD